MKLIIEHEGTIATIESEVETIDDAWEYLFYPALICVGYSPETIKKLLQK
jgi:hypothetical protein